MGGMGRIAVAVVLTAAGPAGAVPFTLMSERNDNAGGGEELSFRSYSSFDDMLGNIDPSDTFSPIDIAGNFSSTGLTYDGLRHIVMFERDDNVGGGEELVFRSYASFEDMLGNVGAVDVFSPIDIAGNFSSTGLTYDGLRYIVMFERDDNVGGGEELVFRSYASFEDLLGNVGAVDVFSPIDIAGSFSSTGLTWDGSQYVVMFERDDNVGGGEELVFRSYASFEDLLGNVGAVDVFSPIDIAGSFSTTGLMAHVDFGGVGEPPPAPIPLPPALALMMAGLAGLAGAGSLRRRGSRVR